MRPERWIYTIPPRLRSLFRWAQADQELDEELRDHLDRKTQEYVARGMAPEEARRLALIELGGIEQTKEKCRDARKVNWVQNLIQDLHFGLRMLRKSPGFAAVAVLTLALGVGVNSTVFTAFDSVALKPLPVKDPQSVVRLQRWFASGASGDIQYDFSYPEYLYYRDQSHAFSGLLAASWPRQVLAAAMSGSLTGSKAPQELSPLQYQLVSENYFSVLGTRMAMGQAFAGSRERAPGSNPVIVLSYPFWWRQLNGDHEIIGKTLEVNATSLTVIGVASEDFIGTGNPPQVPDFWAPLGTQRQLAPQNDWLNEPSNHPLQILGRLAPVASIDQAQAETEVLIRQFAKDHLEQDETIGLTLHRATYFGVTDELWFRGFAAGLMAVVGLVLLVACVNLANMAFAQAASRKKEIATRLALGAGRGRLVRQLLTESILLALIGGLAGLLFSFWATKLEWVGLARLIQVLLGSRILVAPLTPDVRVFLYALVLSLATGVLFGFWPALQSSKASLTDALKTEGSSYGQSSRRSRFRSLLLGVQVSVSMILLISTGLALRALANSQAANPGFETRSAFHLTFNLGNDSAKAAILERQIIARLRTLPEVSEVALANRLPYAGTATRPLLVEASHAAAKGTPSQTLINYVSPSFFAALSIPVVRGRNFTLQETDAELPVAIVSESTSRRAWPGEDPIGKHLKLDLKFDHKWQEFEVVGVAKDVRFFNISRIDPAYVYLPGSLSQSNGLLIRAARRPQDTFASIRASLGNFDRTLLPTLGFLSLDNFMHSQELLPQATAVFTAILAFLAVALAAVGIYGVMAYDVTRRTREVGIRLALGATKTDVRQLLIRQGMLPVIVGAACGLVLSAAISGVLRTILVFPANPDLLFGVSAFDPSVYVGLTALLAGVALLASYLPSRKAMRVDPMVALRYE